MEGGTADSNSAALFGDTDWRNARWGHVLQAMLGKRFTSEREVLTKK